MSIIEFLILMKISRNPCCSFEWIARDLGMPRTTIQNKGNRLASKGYLFGRRKWDRFLTLKGSQYIDEQLKNLDTPPSPKPQ